MIILHGISRIYKPKKGVPVKALDQVDLILPDKGMVFILGKSGSGKSTLLNVVGGLDKYDEGELIIKDKSTKAFNQNDFDSYRNTMVGFIFQEYNVLDDFTVAQNIGLALELQGIKATSEKISEILELVDLPGLGGRKPNELSGGQKQRVAIARALVKDPEIIMADEPTGALDSETGIQILESLKKLSETRLVMVVSHDREFATTYGDRIVEFMDGKIISDVSRTSSSEKMSSPFELNKDQLEIKPGYVLTQEDLRVINQYLQEGKTNLKIAQKGINGSTKFIETDHEQIELSKEVYTPIKSRLPFKSSLKIGASSLKHKKFRLVISIILAAVSLTLFGLSDTFATYNPKKAAEVSIKQAEYDYYSINKVSKTTQQSWTISRDHLMFKEDLDKLNTDFPSSKFVGVVSDGSTSSYHESIFEPITDFDRQVYDTEIVGLAELKTNDLAAGKLSLVAGRLPLNDSEIAISRYMYSVFEKFGYKAPGQMTKEMINNYSQLLNKDFIAGSKIFKIIGIIETKFDLSEYQDLYLESLSVQKRTALTRQIMIEMMTSLHKVLFVNEGYIEKNFTNAGVNRYALNFSLTLGYTPTQEMYYDVIKSVESLKPSNVVYFSGVTTPLGPQDVILTYSVLTEYLLGEGYDIAGMINDHRYNYVSSLDFATHIEPPLRSKGIIIGAVNPMDIPNYINEFYNIFYTDWAYDSIPPTLKSKTTLDKEALEGLIGSLSKRDIYLIKSDYWSENEEIETFTPKLVGIAFEPNNEYGQNRTMFLSEHYFDLFEMVEDGIYTRAISYDTSNDKLLKDLLEYHFTPNGTSYSLVNDVTIILNEINYLIETLSSVFIYIGIGFAVFASLMLLNFITISVSYKKQEIGILRAIGARGRDVLGIFTKEAMIIAIINYVLALVATIVTVFYINSAFKTSLNLPISILNLGIRQIVLMVFISIFVAFISSAIPVTKTARKRPIDAIKNI